MSLGSKLYSLRNQKGLKQEQVAFEIDISQSTYSDWENDVIVPKRENLIKLAEYFDVDLKYFDDEIYKVKIKTITSSVSLINSSNVKIKNSTEAFIKIAESLEKLTSLVEKLIEKD